MRIALAFFMVCLMFFCGSCKNRKTEESVAAVKSTNNSGDSGPAISCLGIEQEATLYFDKINSNSLPKSGEILYQVEGTNKKYKIREVNLQSENIVSVVTSRADTSFSFSKRWLTFKGKITKNDDKYGYEFESLSIIFMGQNLIVSECETAPKGDFERAPSYDPEDVIMDQGYGD